MNNSQTKIKLALPKGRMQQGVFALLNDAGIQISASERSYRPTLSLANFEAKLLKPQSIIQMLSANIRDLGFAGADWVVEQGANLVELLDTELDPVRLVVAAPKGFSPTATESFTIASEYEQLAQTWVRKNGYDARFVRTFGATEVYPPEDADCIIDNVATGNTLKYNGLVILDEVMTSSTRLYANTQCLENPAKRDGIEQLVLLLKSVLDARARVMIEMNVENNYLDAIIRAVPSMRTPTIAPLYNNSGFAVKSAVPRRSVGQLITELKRLGATDIVVSELSQIVC